jgi:glycosyltransferase involved in cell wall biosynthesis
MKIHGERTLTIGYLTSSMSNFDGWGRYSRSLIESVSQHATVRVLTDASAKNESSVVAAAVLPPMQLTLLTQLKVFVAVLRYLRGCDVIHSLVEMYAPGAALAARLLGIRFVMTLHGTYAVPPKGLSMQGMLIRFALKTAALTTTGSRYTEVKARRRVKFGECRFIPNGVDPKEFHVLPNTIREDFIMTVGWLKPRKGMDIVIRAFGLIKDKYPALRCVLVGGIENERFNEQLHVLARDTGAEDRIEFVGRVSEEKLVRLYNTCRIFVFPARDIHENFEGFPMVFYEANACGAPVVTTRGFGSEYVIREGRNGLLVEPDDVQGTAAAIRRLLDDKQLYATMHTEALRIAGEHTWDKIAPMLINFYRDALTYKV